MKLNNRKIAVIGAGIAGLATARALALLGARPIVLEQAGALTQVGAGLQLTPNGMTVLDALGLGSRVRETALTLQDVTLRDHSAGAQVLRMDLSTGATAGNWLAVPRADLIDVLRMGVERVGAEIRLGARVLRMDSRPEKTILTLADGSTLEASVVIAADGLHSVGRQSLGSDVEPFFTGQVAWRCIVDDDPAAHPGVQVFMGPGRHLVSYPLAGGRRNIVAVEERADWAEESWSTEGDPDQLRANFAGFGGPVTDWLAQVEFAHLWGLFRHEIPARWHGGSLVLVGDAAHPTLPFLAQGANLALEDAWVLADTLADAPGVSAALTTFQTRRVERVRRAIKAANANARNYHLRNPLVRLAAHSALRVVGALAPRQMLGRFDWLYRHDVTARVGQLPQHASVPIPAPLAVAGEVEPPKRTEKPVVPRAKPVANSRPRARITLSDVKPKPVATETREAVKPQPALPKAAVPKAAVPKASGQSAGKTADPVNKTPPSAQQPSEVPKPPVAKPPVAKPAVAKPPVKPPPVPARRPVNLDAPYGDATAPSARAPKVDIATAPASVAAKPPLAGTAPPLDPKRDVPAAMPKPKPKKPAAKAKPKPASKSRSKTPAAKPAARATGKKAASPSGKATKAAAKKTAGKSAAKTTPKPDSDTSA